MSNFAGLYLGVDFVDLVILSNIKGNLRVIKSMRTFLFDESSSPEQKDKTQALPTVIKKLVDLAKTNIASLNFGLSQNEVMVRHFNMPYLVESERADAVKFEAQKYLPFKTEETISDYYIIEESKGKHLMEVLFVAVNKQVLESYLSLFKELGVKLNIIDISAVALLRLLSHCKKLLSDQTQVVVYLEKGARASVVIVRNKDVYLAREVTFSISKATFFENVLNNIRLSLDYFKRETKEVNIGDLIICGDDELLDLELYLKENIETVPVQAFNLTNEIEGLNELSRRQLIAIGLAMAHLEKPRPKINLLTHIKPMVSKGLEVCKPLVIEGVSLFLILAILQGFGTISVGAAKKKVAQLRVQKVATIEGLFPEVSQEELLAIENKIKTQIGFLKGLVGKDRFFLTKRLNTLGDFLPQGTWIELFQFIDEIDKARKLEIKGMIFSEDKKEAPIANRMLVDMKANKDFSFGFQDIKLNSLEKTSLYDKELMAFFIECSGKSLDSSGMFSKGG